MKLRNKINKKKVNEINRNLHNGIIFNQTGKFEEAKKIYNKILEIDSKNYDALHFLAITEHKLKKNDKAKELLKIVLKLNENNQYAFNNIGLISHELNEYEDAIKYFKSAIKINSKFAEAYFNLGNTFKQKEQYIEAIKAYNDAIENKNNYSEAYNNRGTTYQEIKEFENASEDFKKAIEINKKYVEAIFNLAITYTKLNNKELARIYYEKAYLVNPNLDFLLGTVLHYQMQECDWENLDERIKKLENEVEKGKKTTVPFSVLSIMDKPLIHKRVSEIFVENYYVEKEIEKEVDEKLIKNNKIRLGYFSADFHNHATTYLMAELLEKHDKSKFELIGFSFGPSKNDEMRQRVKLAFNQFIEVGDLKDKEIALLALDMKIDIAIDLKGYTTDSRPGIFKLRCAPVQISYLGYPGTMGANFIDYIIADHVVIHEKNINYFTEKIIYMPISYQVNDSKRKISNNNLNRKDYDLPDKGFVFCCFNNNYKITPQTFEVWMTLLKKINTSVLWLLGDNKNAINNLRKEAEIRGVNPDRLVFAYRVPLEEHLARHKLADLFLDTLPYNAHTTASDALWAGLPVLTCVGQSFASRVSASLLNSFKLNELITYSYEEYENKAIEIAKNPSLIKAFKAKIINDKYINPLFNPSLFVKYLEIAFHVVHNRSKNSLPKVNINIVDN